MNNIKGLEFPFIICITIGIIGKGTNYRNSIYMTLTRSFLTSYFLVEELLNSDFIESYSNAMNCIKNEECLQLIEPTEKEKQDIKYKITINSNKNAQILEMINEVLLEYKDYLSPKQKNIVKDLSATLSSEPIETVKSKMVQIINSVIGR